MSDCPEYLLPVIQAGFTVCWWDEGTERLAIWKTSAVGPTSLWGSTEALGEYVVKDQITLYGRFMRLKGFPENEVLWMTRHPFLWLVKVDNEIPPGTVPGWWEREE